MPAWLKTTNSTALLYLAAVLNAVTLGVYALSTPIEQIADIIPDDSFFYLRIAQFFALGEGFSFDGSSQTYGFQPLWQWICIGLRAVIGEDPATLFYAVILLCVLLHAATALALGLLARRCFGSLAAWLAFALWAFNPEIAQWSLGLKENVLYGFLLVIAFLYYDDIVRRKASTFRVACFGIVLGLMIFNRVNAVITVTILLSGILVFPGLEARATLGPIFGRARWSTLLRASAAMLLIAGPWYAFAKYWFGTALPTSGISKFVIAKAHVEGVWNEAWLSLGHVTHAIGELPRHLRETSVRAFGALLPSIFALICGGALLTLVTRAPRLPNASSLTTRAWLLVLICASAAFGCLANVMFLEPFLDYARWYTVPEYIALPLLIAMALVPLARALRVAPRLTLISTAICLVTPFLWYPTPKLESPIAEDFYTRAPSSNQQLIEFGLWAAEHVPDDMRIGIWDPGIVSYFSQKALTSLDPLMNSREYQESEIGDQVAYCKKHGIRYVFGSTIRLPDGSLTYRYLMPGSNRVLWQPWPEQPLGWGEPDPFWTIVELLEMAGEEAARLPMDAFAFGAVRSPSSTLDRRPKAMQSELAALRKGSTWQADVLRIALDDAETDAVMLRFGGGDAPLPVAFGDDGWARLDLRAQRGRHLRLELSDGAAGRVRDLQIVDYSMQ